ncbi:MAG: hypothetical protein R2824_19660 [Saprospiraceae bacterium]|nr:hypothetical protein [Lewinella sp.]
MARQVGMQAGEVLQGKTLYFWRTLQYLLFIAGAGIFFSLIFYPDLGINLLWNVLIPVAPLILVLMPGLWRNICPLSFISLLPRRIGFSGKKRLKLAMQGKFMLTAVCLLYLILPLRHIMLDTSGWASAALLLLVGGGAFVSGATYEWKSGWCSGLCPVSPVEKLYGSKPLVTFPNAQCTSCRNCVIPCPDSAPQIHPLAQQKTPEHRLSGLLLAGGLPGFIWGWFHVPDFHGMEGWHHLIMGYGLPLLSMAFSLTVFCLLSKTLMQDHLLLLIRIFSAAAVVCYYWYRLPALIGFGIFPGDGVLVDLSRDLPFYAPWLLQLSVLLLFSWWLIRKPELQLSWKIKPPFEKTKRHSRI